MTKAKQIPSPGDEYTPLFQSDLQNKCWAEWGILQVAFVEYETDTQGTWAIEASDGVGYDCCWSEKFQIWCYNLE